MFTGGKYTVPLTLQMFGLWSLTFMKLEHYHKIHYTDNKFVLIEIWDKY
jgi:hypothetical protein